MERLIERLGDAEMALNSMNEALARRRASVIERDAAILRFAYTFEAVWKAAQLYLAEHEGLEAGSPKRCVRMSRGAGLLTDDEAERALAMADDRNLVVHTYKEALAKEIFGRLADHAAILAAWLAAMRHELQA